MKPYPVLQTVFTQRIVFAEAPPRHVRQALYQPGFRYTGTHWQCSNGNASVIGFAQLDDILKAMTPEK